MSRVLVGACLALTILTGGVAPVARGSSPPSVVDRTVTVEAGDSSSLLLDVARAVPYQLTGDDKSSLLVRGNGRAVVAALQKTGSAAPAEAVVVARFNGCAAPGCAADPDSSPMSYQREAIGNRRADDGRPILEAGTYRLSVLTDGAPATVTLALGTSSGVLTLRTDTAAESAISPVEETAAVPAVPVAWSAGTRVTLVSPNTVVLGFLQQDTPGGTVAGAAGACHHAGAPPLLGHFAPGCPVHPTSSGGSATNGAIATETLTLGSDERARLAASLPAVGGSQLAGFWSLRGGATTTPLAFFAHLRLH